MSHDKDEVVKMAREAGFAQDWQFAVPPATLSSFATLCRAPLVAENAALREQLKALGVYNESTKAELARVQAVAEWQGSADGGKSWRRIDKPRGESIESRVAYLRNMTNSQGRPIYLIRALYTTPKPAAQESPSAVPVVDMLVEALERKLPGGKQTDDFESSRIGDYNQGWNDYRKAVKKMFKNINMNSSENSNPDAYLYSLEYGEKVVDTKVSIHQLNYPFGVAGADYLVRNDDGVSYVRQTKLYAALSRALAAGQKFIKENNHG